MTTNSDVPEIHEYMGRFQYSSLEEWAEVNDYYRHPESGEWYRDGGPWSEQVDLEGELVAVIEGMMESGEWQKRSFHEVYALHPDYRHYRKIVDVTLQEFADAGKTVWGISPRKSGTMTIDNGWRMTGVIVYYQEGNGVLGMAEVNEAGLCVRDTLICHPIREEQ